jgi:CMP-N-acetylneuraminic acid synthetase
MMKIAAFIPIKLNSERLPGKNIKEFDNGKPLITYILDTVSKVKRIDESYVFCSSEDIGAYIPENIKFIKRDSCLDNSSTSITEVIDSFTRTVAADIYVLLHATAPFITSQSIEKALDAVLNQGYDSAVSVIRHQEILWQGGKPVNYDTKNIPRTQDMEPFYTETTGLYVFKHELTEQKRRVGDKPYLLEVSEIEAVDINEPMDFEVVNAIYNHIIRDKNTL